MMLRLFFLATVGVLLIIVVSCSGGRQSAATTVNVTEESYAILFEPSKRVENLDGVSLQIRPVDGRMMDSVSLETSKYSGVYSSQSSTVDADLELELEIENDRARNRYVYTVSDFLKELEYEDLIGEIAADVLLADVYDRAEELYPRILNIRGYEGKTSSVESQPDSRYNPYIQGGRHLSVFEVTIDNQSSRVFSVNASDILVSSDNEQLYPLDIEYFSFLTAGSVTENNLQRLNMPSQLRVPPGTKLVKYFAVPPLNPDASQLNISLLRGDEASSFVFSQSVEFESSSSQYFIRYGEYTMSFKVTGAVTTDKHILISHDNGSMWLTNELRDDVWLLESEGSRHVTVYVLAKTNKGYAFGFTEFNLTADETYYRKEVALQESMNLKRGRD